MSSPFPSSVWFDSVLDALPDPVLVVKPLGDVAWINRAAGHLLEPGDVEPQASNRARISRFVSDLVEHGSPSTRDTLMLIDPLEAGDLPMGVTAERATWSNGEPVVVVTLRRDSGEKTMLIANASHELRTPLNAILGYTSLLLRGVHGVLSERQRASLQRVEANGQHLLALITDLLDMSVTDAGKMQVRISRFEPGQLVRETLEELEPLIGQAELPVYADWNVTLPSMASDRRKVKQIILNLVTNALKFTRAGEVRIELAHVDQQLKLSVADTGIGIAPHDHEKIFEDFRQIDTVLRRTQSGAGLGLAICRRFATLLGGSVSVASDVGKGATFTLLLPMEWNDGTAQA
jgi:signal transduction histidine kinase